MPLALKAMVACDASNPYGILKAILTGLSIIPTPVHNKQLEWSYSQAIIIGKGA
jgi:hypothetical protein